MLRDASGTPSARSNHLVNLRATVQWFYWTVSAWKRTTGVRLYSVFVTSVKAFLALSEDRTAVQRASLLNRPETFQVAAVKYLLLQRHRCSSTLKSKPLSRRWVDLVTISPGRLRARSFTSWSRCGLLVSCAEKRHRVIAGPTPSADF